MQISQNVHNGVSKGCPIPQVRSENRASAVRAKPFYQLKSVDHFKADIVQTDNGLSGRCFLIYQHS